MAWAHVFANHLIPETAWQPCVTNMASFGFNFINRSKITPTGTLSLSVLQALGKGEQPGKAGDFHRSWTGDGEKGRQGEGKEETEERKRGKK